MRSLISYPVPQGTKRVPSCLTFFSSNNAVFWSLDTYTRSGPVLSLLGPESSVCIQVTITCNIAHQWLRQDNMMIHIRFWYTFSSIRFSFWICCQISRKEGDVLMLHPPVILLVGFVEKKIVLKESQKSKWLILLQEQFTLPPFPPLAILHPSFLPNPQRTVEAQARSSNNPS